MTQAPVVGEVAAAEKIPHDLGVRQVGADQKRRGRKGRPFFKAGFGESPADHGMRQVIHVWFISDSKLRFST